MCVCAGVETTYQVITRTTAVAEDPIYKQDAAAVDPSYRVLPELMADSASPITRVKGHVTDVHAQ
eukprot:56378-Eustigmatos_ZCMA.PRE.2